MIGDNYLLYYKFKCKESDDEKEDLFKLKYKKPECYYFNNISSVELVTNSISTVYQYIWKCQNNKSTYINYFLNQGQKIIQYKDVIQKLSLNILHSPYFSMKEEIAIKIASVFGKINEKKLNDFKSYNFNVIKQFIFKTKSDANKIINKSLIEHIYSKVTSLNIKEFNNDKNTNKKRGNNSNSNILDKNSKNIMKNLRIMITKEIIAYTMLINFYYNNFSKSFTGNGFYELTPIQSSLFELYNDFWNSIIKLLDKSNYQDTNNSIYTYCSSELFIKEEYLNKNAKLISNKELLSKNKEFISKEDNQFEKSIYCVECKNQPRNAVGICNHLLYCDDCIKQIKSCIKCGESLKNYVKLFRC